MSLVGWVHNGRVNGDLGVSRSIGDIKFKAFNEHTLKQPLLSMQHTLGSGNTDSGIPYMQLNLTIVYYFLANLFHLIPTAADSAALFEPGSPFWSPFDESGDGGIWADNQQVGSW